MVPRVSSRELPGRTPVNNFEAARLPSAGSDHAPATVCCCARATGVIALVAVASGCRTPAQKV